MYSRCIYIYIHTTGLIQHVMTWVVSRYHTDVYMCICKTRPRRSEGVLAFIAKAFLLSRKRHVYDQGSMRAAVDEFVDQLSELLEEYGG